MCYNKYKKDIINFIFRDNLGLKIMKLEPLDFIDAFPKENSPDFLNLVTENWKNLIQNNLEGKNCYTAILYRQLKPNRNKRNKFYVFILWLYLCFDRPWEKNWKYSLSEKRGKDFYIKISKKLEKLPIDFPNYPETQMLRKYLKKENTKDVISSLSFKSALMKLEEILKFVLSPIRLNQRIIDQLKIIFKFIDIIESQRWIKKRDLYKKLRIKKDDCDHLLEEAEEDGFVKIQNFPCNSTWVIYTDS